VKKHGHPDLHLLMSQAEAVRRGRSEPDGKKKPSEQIVVEDVRQLASNLRMTAFAGGARVAVVLAAERMNPNAQNALLKTLEEPGANTTLVLLAADEKALLPTIVSRCQRLRFSPSPVMQVQVEPPLSELLNALASGDLAVRLEAAETIGRDRSQTEHVLNLLDLALVEALRRGEGMFGLSWQQTSALLDAVIAQRRAFAQNANAQLALEELLLMQAPRVARSGT
jgi:DNA polymerase-3 subunit delta'